MKSFSNIYDYHAHGKGRPAFDECIEGGAFMDADGRYWCYDKPYWFGSSEQDEIDELLEDMRLNAKPGKVFHVPKEYHKMITTEAQHAAAKRIEDEFRAKAKEINRELTLSAFDRAVRLVNLVKKHDPSFIGKVLFCPEQERE